MPIAPSFQTLQLKELGEQIKIAPEHIRQKQMDAAEKLTTTAERTINSQYILQIVL